jgi:uncharacterized protein YciI
MKEKEKAMFFILNAYDYKDSEALNRRQTAREDHLKNMAALKASGVLKFAWAHLEGGVMCGSMLVLEVENRNEIEAYLKEEPYRVQKVWERVEITPCQVPPMFL